MSNRIGGGWRGSGYLGTKASQPPEVWIVDRDPTQYDTAQYSLMDVWLNEVTDTPWMLVSLKGDSNSRGMLAKWIRFGEGDLQTLTGNDGTPISPINFNINVVGTTASGLFSTGNVGTATIAFGTTGGGGVGQTLSGNDSVLVFFSNNTGNIDIVGAAASGLTFTGDPVTHALTLNTTGGGAVAQTITNQDASVVPPSNAGNWNFTGAHGINTTGVAGTSTFTANVDNTLTLGDLFVVPANNDALTLTSGSLTISGTGANAAGNLNLPATTGDERQGEVTVAGVRFISSYGPNNTFIGSGSGSINNFGAFTGSNTALGAAALTNISSGGVGAVGNTAIGYNALNAYTFSTPVDTTGGNTALGALALQTVVNGAENTALGWSALASTTGSFNTAIGAGALFGLTTGAANTAIGTSAGVLFGMNALLTGSFNILIGDSVAANYAGAESNNIIMSNTGVVGENNTIRIGTDGAGGGQQNRCFIAGIRGITTGNADAIAVLIDSAGQLGTVSSSIRYKENVQDMGDYSEDILRLRPVTFQYKKRSSERVCVGLIAEEVGERMPDLVVFDQDGLTETVRYNDLIPLMLNELQKAHQRIDRLEHHIRDIERLMLENAQ